MTSKLARNYFLSVGAASVVVLATLTLLITVA